jgi:phage terminase large subunit-like protein
VTPDWTTARPDWEARITARESLIPPPLFPAEAAAALSVMDALRVVDMPGSPTFGEISRPWVRSFVAAVFGAYDPDTGRRLIREFVLLISKKNTKSTTAGLLMLTMLIRNWRQAGEFGILAPTVEVAHNAYKPAADAIKADEELSDLLHVQDHIRTITHRQTKGTLQVVAAESDAVAGKKWIVTLVDELWLFGKRPGAENMLREATGGMASRPEGAVLWLSTQSDDAPAGVFRQKLMYARGVRDGRINDPQFCPALYEFPGQMLKDKAYLEPKNFYITNPNLGASVDVEFIEREHRKAVEDGPESMVGFLAKHLNVEIGLALRSDRWAGADYWERQGTAGLTLDEVLRRSEVVTVGIDGGGLDDLLGLSVVGRDSQTHDWLSWSHAWAHPSVLDRRKADAPRFRDFERDGDLTIVERIGDDVDQVAAIVARVDASGLLDRIGVDPHGIGSILDAMVSAGVEAEKVTGITQGWKMTASVKTTERRLAEGALWHSGAPMMAWCVGNAKVEPKGNAVAITKQAAGWAKIDPLMALFNAGALMALNPQGAGKSWWDSVETDRQAA